MLFLLVFACGVEIRATPLPPGVLQGHVFFDDGTPAVGAEVTVYTTTVTTDMEGYFELAGLPTGEAPVAIRAEGAAPTQGTVLTEEGKTTNAAFQVLALRSASLPDAAAGGTVSTDDGLTLTFAPNALVDVNGTPVSGAVDVQYALLNTALSLIAAPGGLLTEGRDGTPVPLVSNGMVSVALSHQGVEVQPVLPVELSFPIIGVSAPACEEFRLYGFDEGSGVWVEEGGGEVVGDRFVADVEHFSYWNCDAPAAGDGCIDVTLKRDGSPVVHERVGVWVSNGTAATPTTDALGAFRIPAPVGAVVTLGVVLDAEGRVDADHADAIWSVGPLTVPNAEDGCADAGTVEVTGVDQDGDGQPVQPWGWECYDQDPTVTEPCPGGSESAAGSRDSAWGSGGSPDETGCP